MVSAVLGAVGGLVIGRLVEPSTLGLFNGISLVLSYAPLLGLGVSAGLSRELPYFIGKGDRRHAEDLAAVAQMWALIIGGLFFVALVAVSGWQLTHGSFWEAAGWFTNAIMVLLMFYTDYLQVTFRTAHDFARLALRRVAQQSALVVLVVLVVPLDFYGLCLRVILAGALTVALLFRARPIQVGPAWSTQHLKHLLRIGLPIFVVYQVFYYWTVIDQTLVLSLGGTRLMGLYSMVILAMGTVQTIPGAVAQVLYPRMTEQYGGGRSLREVAKGVAKPIAAAAVAVIPVILLAWWLVEPLTQWVVPKYIDAVSAIKWALPICFISCFEAAYALFSVGRRQDLRLIGILAGMAAYGGVLLWLTQDGVYLAAFPQAMLIGRAVCLVVSYALIGRLCTKGGDSGRSAA